MWSNLSCVHGLWCVTLKTSTVQNMEVKTLLKQGFGSKIMLSYHSCAHSKEQKQAKINKQTNKQTNKQQKQNWLVSSVSRPSA